MAIIRNILTSGGFTKISSDAGFSVYTLENNLPKEVTQAARRAIQRAIDDKGYSYEGNLKSFSEALKIFPYLLKNKRAKTLTLASKENEVIKRLRRTMATNFPKSSGVKRALQWSQSVCLLRQQNGSGTGTLVADGLIMTAEHVVPTREKAKQTWAHFVDSKGKHISVRLNPSKKRGGFFFSLPRYKQDGLSSNERFDETHRDFVLVGLRRSEKLKKIKPCSIFKTASPKYNGAAHILQNPICRINNIGKLELLSREQRLCSQEQAVHWLNEFVIHYFCNTFYGSSGALLFNDKGKPYAFHYGKCDEVKCKEDKKINCKIAVRLDGIVHYLRAHDVGLDRFKRAYVADSLKRVYQKRNKLQLMFEERSIPIDSIYAPLILIEGKNKEDEKKEGAQADKAIELEKLFEHKRFTNPEKQRVIIYGSAGTGKSTMCHRIAHQWATGCLWPQFKLLFWIKLCNLNSVKYRSNRPHTSHEILQKECGIRSSSLKFLLKEESFQRDTLIVLDGYDELPAEAANSQNPKAHLSHFLKEINETFPHILITTRSRTVPGFNENASEFKILGFDDKSIEKYIENFFRADKKGQANIKQALRTRLVRNLARIPINLEILCCLARENGTLSREVTTITSIYSKLINRLFRQYMTKHLGLNPADIEDEPNPRGTADNLPLNQTLEELAWTATQNDRLYLHNSESSHEISDALQVSNKQLNAAKKISDLKNLGLLTIEKNRGYFVHPTFQEFFAASKLAGLYREQKFDEAIEHIARIKEDLLFAEERSELRRQRMLWMVAGLLCQREDGTVQKYFNHLSSVPPVYVPATSKEMHLLERCFEECPNRTSIPEYSLFINNVIGYIKAVPLPGMRLTLLKHGMHTLQHPDVEETILELLENQETRLEIIELIHNLAANNIPLPNKIVSEIRALVKNTDLDRYIRACAADAIGAIATNKQACCTEEDVRGLLEIVEDISLDWCSRSFAIDNLEKIARSEQACSKKALEGLIQITQDTPSDYEKDIQRYAERAIKKLSGKKSLTEKASSSFQSRKGKEPAPE